MGYKQVEGYERDKGIFWGMSNTDFKKYLDEIGLTMISSHCDTSKDFERKAAELAAIGINLLFILMRELIKPWMITKKWQMNLIRKEKPVKKNDIRFAFHNHAFSFNQMDGQYPQDVLMEGTDPDLVDFEIDLYWVVAAGADPETWMKKYGKRFRLCHVKDRSKSPVEDNGKNSVNLGTGSIDYPGILKTAKDNGVEYYIVEQEFYPTHTPLESAKADAEYMKNLTI